MEIWDIYDENLQKTGKRIERDGPKPKPGEYHLVVHVCLFHENKMLIQRRAPQKKAWSGYWDVTAGGSALAGETWAQAASRELREEMGIAMQFSLPQLILPVKNVFDGVFLAETEEALPAFCEEEVCDAKWATEAEIADMVCAERFLPYRKEYLSLLFAMRERYGALTNDAKKFGGNA